MATCSAITPGYRPSIPPYENRLSLKFGQTYVRIPLRKSPHILHADALETDWTGLLPPAQCSFVLGNPPFVGAKFRARPSVPKSSVSPSLAGRRGPWTT